MTDAAIIDGTKSAARLREGLAREIEELAATGVRPGLAVVLVGADPASQTYVRSKIARAGEIGIQSFDHKLPEDVDQSTLLALIERLNADDSVDGILVQMPLPGHIDSGLVLQAIDPAKDVDGFHPVNVGRLAVGLDGLVPCTPKGCLILLTETLGDLSGAEAVVIGRSTIVGRPMAALLLGASCTVTIAHSKTRDLPGVVRRADIVVAAVGRPRMVTGDWLKPGATVIDVGINRVIDESGKGRLVGDVDFASAVTVAGAITPVPGGVGPMTIACLMANTVLAARRRVRHG